MVASANMVEVAALVGDTARATMLAALMGGQALTATELAFQARISRPTASEHLVRLLNARLISVTPSGRFRYYRITSPLVAQMLESMIAVAALEMPPRHRPRSARDEALCLARSCYDHMAGRLGVAVADALIERDYMHLSADGGVLTDAGHRFLCDFGARLETDRRSKRIFCRACLDWSERRYHVGGLVGAELQRRFLELGWVARTGATRAFKVTDAGKVELKDIFGIDLDVACTNRGLLSPRQPGESSQRAAS
jgi:DNA-binding transcriptional ArsR family regulator